MKILTFLMTLVLLSMTISLCTAAKFDDMVLEILEEFRKRMCHKIEKFNLPPLDPLQIKELNGIQVDDAKIGVKDLTLKGLSHFIVPHIKMSIPTLKLLITVVVPKIVLKTKYSINGKVGMLDLNGKGDLDLEVTTANVTFEGRLKWTSATRLTKFEVIQIKPIAEKLKCTITGLFPDPETNKFISKMIEDIGIEVLVDYFTVYADDINKKLSDIITEPIKDLDPKDLIEMIKSGEPIFGENDPKPDCKFN